MPDYAQYQSEVCADVEATLQQMQAQPILFIGSGFSLRYGGGPNWELLLADLAAHCPLIDKDFAYYNQKYKGNLPQIGSAFAEMYFEWAWSKDGRKNFPDNLFSNNADRQVYFKHAIAELLSKVKATNAPKVIHGELSALKQMGAHAVITTNYDELIEPLFPGYEVIVGQQVFRKQSLVVGEVFKIHGSIADPETLVVTQEDYDVFDQTKRYLSAKLLTYFAEHPLLFVGYSVSDQNIKTVLYDVSKMYSAGNGPMDNIYILQWDKNQDGKSYPAHDHVLEVGDDINVRIKSITANSFEWVFKAFGVGGTMDQVNLKALRSLAARTMHLIRTDIPKKNVEVDYDALEHAISSGNDFAKQLYGIAIAGAQSSANVTHPFTPAMLAEQLGLKHWVHANQLIKRVKDERGYDMKSHDNNYYCHIKTGKSKGSRVHKYSDLAVALLQKVRDGEAYEISAAMLAEQPAS